MLDYGIFYEFIPMNEMGNENPRAVPLTEVETGRNYAMVITTAGGLWRYQIGDTMGCGVIRLATPYVSPRSVLTSL